MKADDAKRKILENSGLKKALAAAYRDIEAEINSGRITMHHEGWVYDKRRFWKWSFYYSGSQIVKQTA